MLECSHHRHYRRSSTITYRNIIECSRRHLQCRRRRSSSRRRSTTINIFECCHSRSLRRSSHKSTFTYSSRCESIKNGEQKIRSITISRASSHRRI
jgi:hypothetical protein